MLIYGGRKTLVARGSHLAYTLLCPGMVKQLLRGPGRPVPTLHSGTKTRPMD
jgi:hypothetical protein